MRILLIACACTLMVACAEPRKGRMERAGERIDEVADNIRDGDSPLHRKGPLERAGEDLDDAIRD